MPHDPDVKALLRIAAVWNVSVARTRSLADFIFSSPLMQKRYERPVEDLADYQNWEAPRSRRASGVDRLRCERKCFSLSSEKNPSEADLVATLDPESRCHPSLYHQGRVNMYDELRWVEGEFLALESPRQGGEDWFFLQPPLFADVTEPVAQEDVARRARAVDQKGNQEHSETTPPSQTKLFVD